MTAGPRKGSIFRVKLPLCTESEGEEHTLPKRDVDHKLTLLVIDDTEPILMTIKDGLESLGQTVLTVDSGPRGLGVFQQEPVDAVICDLSMPQMSGWEVANGIRDICKVRGTPKPPFVMLSACGKGAEDERKMAQLGVDLFLCKPVNLAQLLQTVSDLIH